MKKLLLFALILAAVGSTFAQNDTRQRFYRHLGTDTLSIGKVPGYLITRTGDSLFFTTSGGTRIKFAPLAFSGDIAASQITSGTIAAARLPWNFSAVSDQYSIPVYNGSGVFASSQITAVFNPEPVVYHYRFNGGINYPTFSLGPHPNWGGDSVSVTGNTDGDARITPGISSPHISSDTYFRAPTTALAGSNVDWNTGTAFTKNLLGSVIMTFSNLPSGKHQVISIAFTNLGSGTYSISWPAGVKWAGGVAPTHTVGSGKTDVFTFIYFGSGSTVYGSALLDF